MFSFNLIRQRFSDADKDNIWEYPKSAKLLNPGLGVRWRRDDTEKIASYLVNRTDYPSVTFTMIVKITRTPSADVPLIEITARVLERTLKLGMPYNVTEASPPDDILRKSLDDFRLSSTLNKIIERHAKSLSHEKSQGTLRRA